MSQWLDKKKVRTLQASDWNELTQMLRRIFQEKRSGEGDIIDIESQIDVLSNDCLKDIKTSQIIAIVDIDLLDLSTNIWKEQLNYLGKYSRNTTFAWILNHDTHNSIKMELRRKGHLIMVNKPLYKSKMIQILTAVKDERNLELQTECESSSNTHDYLDIAAVNHDGSFSQLTQVNNYLVDFGEDNTENMGNGDKKEKITSRSCVGALIRNSDEKMNEQKLLKGLKILVAEDKPILQRVTSIMLEKVGARVTVVGDGLQAVNALKFTRNDEGFCSIDKKTSEAQGLDRTFPPFDLILMDCQMPKMDGYEATKEIRRLECGAGIHVPIVALTAHAMSSDEAKCLDVGMDAYLTKPIDYKLMISTIISLTSTSEVI